MDKSLDELMAEMRTERDTAIQENTVQRALVAEIKGLLPGDDPVAAIKSLVVEHAAMKQRVLAAEVKDIIHTLVPLTALRPVVAEMLGPVGSKEEAITRVQELMASEHMNRIATALVLESGGPKVVVNGNGFQPVEKFEDTPERRAAARGRFGF